MNLEHDVGARFHQFGLSGRQDFRRLTGSIANQKIARQRAGVNVLIDFRRGSFEEDSRLLIFEVIRSRLTNVGDDVVNDGAFRRTDFRSLNPLIFREAGRHNYVLILDHARFRHGKFSGQLKNHVRLWNAPSFHKIHRYRHVLGIAFGCAGSRPSHNDIDLFLRERPVIREMSNLRIGKPWRHQFLLHGQFHGSGPRPRLFIREHGKRSSFTRSMATLAIFLQDRRDIFRKCRSVHISHLRKETRCRANCEQ